MLGCVSHSMSLLELRHGSGRADTEGAGAVQNRFAVRAQIKRLVLTPQGRGRLRFDGKEHSAHAPRDHGNPRWSPLQRTFIVVSIVSRIHGATGIG